MFYLQWFVFQIKALHLNRVFNCNGWEISSLSIIEVQRLYISKYLTPFSLTKCYLERIKQINNRSHAVIQVNPDALDIASQYQVFQWYESREKSLWGIPVLVQDDMATLDEMETTAGSLALLGVKPTRESQIVTKLLEKGAIIIGKTNLAEFMGIRFGNDIPTFSSRGGFVKNPFNKKQYLYGANSGSAAAVKSNMAMVAICSSVDGSIDISASAMKVIGFTPTTGIISTDGNIPSYNLIGSIGYITKDIEDSLIVTKALAPSILSHDYVNKKMPYFFHPYHYDNFPQDLNIGILKYNLFNNNLEQFSNPLMLEVFEFLRGCRAFLIELNNNATQKLPSENHIDLLFGFDKGLNKYLVTTENSEPSKPMNNFSDLVDFFNHTGKDTNFPDLFIDYKTKLSKRYEYYADLSYLQTNHRTILTNIMMTHKVKVLILPSQSLSGSFSAPANLGFPVITISIEHGRKKSFSLTLVALPHHDPLILELASLLLKKYSSK